MGAQPAAARRLHLLTDKLTYSRAAAAAHPAQIAFANGPHSYGLAKTVLDMLDIIVEWTFLIDIVAQFFVPVQPLLVRHNPVTLPAAAAPFPSHPHRWARPSQTADASALAPARLHDFFEQSAERSAYSVAECPWVISALPTALLSQRHRRS